MTVESPPVYPCCLCTVVSSATWSATGTGPPRSVVCRSPGYCNLFIFDKCYGYQNKQHDYHKLKVHMISIICFLIFKNSFQNIYQIHFNIIKNPKSKQTQYLLNLNCSVWAYYRKKKATNKISYNYIIVVFILLITPTYSFFVSAIGR